jgi:hypothetical protein
MSKYYLKLDANGYIFGKAFSDAPPDGYVETDLDIYSISADQMHRVVNGEIIATGIPNMPPNEYDIWDEVNGGWIDGRDLDQKKADKWIKIKAARDAQEFGTFDWGGYTFQCDEVSQRRIQGAVQLSAIDDTLTLDWTLADNSVQNFAASEYVQIGVALATHVSGCHARGRILRQEIESATTEAELEAIVW